MSRNDYGLKFGESKQYYGNVPDGRQAMKRGGDDIRTTSKLLRSVMPVMIEDTTKDK